MQRRQPEAQTNLAEKIGLASRYYIKNNMVCIVFVYILSIIIYFYLNIFVFFREIAGIGSVDYRRRQNRTRQRIPSSFVRFESYGNRSPNNGNEKNNAFILNEYTYLFIFSVKLICRLKILQFFVKSK